MTEDRELEKAVLKLHEIVKDVHGWSDLHPPNPSSLWETASLMVANWNLRNTIDRAYERLWPSKECLDLGYQFIAILSSHDQGHNFIKAFAETGRKFTDEPLSRGRTAKDQIVESVLSAMCSIGAKTEFAGSYASLLEQFSEPLRRNVAITNTAYLQWPGNNVQSIKNYRQAIQRRTTPVHKPENSIRDFDKGYIADSPNYEPFASLDAKILGIIKSLDLGKVCEETEKLLTSAEEELFNLMPPGKIGDYDIGSIRLGVYHSTDLSRGMTVDDSLRATKLFTFINKSAKIKSFAEMVEQQNGILHYGGPSKSFVRRTMQRVMPSI